MDTTARSLLGRRLLSVLAVNIVAAATLARLPVASAAGDPAVEPLRCFRQVAQGCAAELEDAYNQSTAFGLALWDAERAYADANAGKLNNFDHCVRGLLGEKTCTVSLTGGVTGYEGSCWASSGRVCSLTTQWLTTGVNANDGMVREIRTVCLPGSCGSDDLSVLVNCTRGWPWEQGDDPNFDDMRALSLGSQSERIVDFHVASGCDVHLTTGEWVLAIAGGVVVSGCGCGLCCWCFFSRRRRRRAGERDPLVASARQPGKRPSVIREDDGSEDSADTV